MSEFRNELLQDISTILDDFFSESDYSAELAESIKKMIFYMIPKWNNRSDMATAFVMGKCCKIMKPNISDEELEMARWLGCICQMLQTYYIALDDYLDDSDQRYGQLTWSKLQGHSKSVVVPDISILRAVAFFTLRKRFSHLPSIYHQALHLFIECDISSVKGICLEKHHLIQNVKDGKISLESLNIQTFEKMFCLQSPVFIYLILSLSMTITGYKVDEHRDLFKYLEAICDNYTVLLKLADDYNEIFCPSDDFESSEDDIRKGQFTWLFLKAKESCKSDDEIKDLLNNYGVDSDDSVIYFKKLLEKIDIHNLYKKYQEVLTQNVLNEMNKDFGKAEKVKEMFKWTFEFFKRLYE